MRTQKKAAAYGIAATALAISVILAGTTFGFIPLANPAFNPNASAVLSVLLTDPPSVPSGVNAVYLTYTDVAIHVAGLGDGGWVSIPSSGELETMSLVNLGQSISTSRVPSGTYDQIALSVSATKVEYAGHNYSATLDGGRLLAPIIRGLVLNSTHAGAAIIDFQLRVLNLGSQTDPSFAIVPSAKALQVPRNEVTHELANRGFKLPLDSRAWFRSYQRYHSDGVTLGSVTLTPNSFSFTLTDFSFDRAGARLAFLTPVGPGGQSTELSSRPNSVFFVVHPDGSVTLLRERLPDGFTLRDLRSYLSSSGYVLTPGSSRVFSSNGVVLNLQGSGLVPGTTYAMTLVGEQTTAVQFVTVS